MTFQDLNLDASIYDALQEAGYKKPTPIQAQSIPQVLKGKDLLACAQTGTGKTAAFLLPIIQLLHQRQQSNHRKGKRYIKSLIVTPTRELAIQISEQMAIYGQFTSLRHTVVFGGVGKQPQIAKLRKGVDVLVATPGRLLDLQQQGHINLNHLEIFVLDEADRMLDMGFIHDVRRILRLIPKQRQSLFLSATMPDNIVELSNQILTKPVKIEITPPSSTAETVEQQLYFVDKKDKKHLLLHLLQNELDGRVLVFTRTKYGADKLVRFLGKQGVKAAAIHGNKSQNARQKALAQFKNKKIQLLVATDIASRGIDIDSLEYVLNYEVPNVAETYVHRIGRSGRAGAAGYAISLCEETERPYIHGIQKLTGLQIPVVEEHPYPTENPQHSADITAKPPVKKQQKKKQSNQGNRNKKRNNNRKKKRYFKNKRSKA